MCFLFFLFNLFLLFLLTASFVFFFFFFFSFLLFQRAESTKRAGSKPRVSGSGTGHRLREKRTRRTTTTSTEENPTSPRSTTWRHALVCVPLRTFPLACSFFLRLDHLSLLVVDDASGRISPCSWLHLPSRQSFSFARRHARFFDLRRTEEIRSKFARFYSFSFGFFFFTLWIGSFVCLFVYFDLFHFFFGVCFYFLVVLGFVWTVPLICLFV